MLLKVSTSISSPLPFSLPGKQSNVKEYSPNTWYFWRKDNPWNLELSLRDWSRLLINCLAKLFLVNLLFSFFSENNESSNSGEIFL